MEELFRDYLEQTIVARFPEIERVSGISVEEFKRKYVDNSKPVIITDSAVDWKAMKQWDHDFFLDKCGDIKVQQSLYDPKTCSETTVGDVIRRIRDNSDVVYIQEWWIEKDFPEIRNYFSVPNYFHNDWHTKIFEKLPMHLWIGSGNAITPIHQDGVGINVWTAQISGHKRWIMCHQDATISIDADGKPDIDGFLNDSSAQLCYSDLEPGDILFVPKRWWHRTRGLTQAISLNTQYVTDDDCVPYIQRILQVLLALSVDHESSVKEKNPTLYNAYLQRAKIWHQYINESSAPKIAY
jgi:hypothetical protein